MGPLQDFLNKIERPERRYGLKTEALYSSCSFLLERTRRGESSMQLVRLHASNIRQQVLC